MTDAIYIRRDLTVLPAVDVVPREARLDGMLILLVVPPYRTTDTLTTQLYPMPYAGTLLGAVLRNAGAHVELKDFLLPAVRHPATPPPSFAGKSAPPFWHFGLPMDQCLAWIDENIDRYDAVGLHYAQCNLWEGSQAIAQRVKMHGKPLVVGGPFATSSPVQVQAQSGADVLVRNEAEDVVAAAFDRVAHGWRGHITGLPVDLESLPLPAWDLAPPANYPSFGGRPRGVLAVSRGCPWHCTFCSVWTIMSRKHRRVTPERIVAELEHLWDHGVRYFSFLDDNLFISRKAVDEVLGAIDDLKVRIPGFAATRYYVEEGIEVRMAAEPDMIARIARAGFGHVALGLETVNDAQREAAKKPYTAVQFKQALENCHDAGVTTKAFYIIGFPNDTVASVCADLVEFGRLGLAARPNNLKLYPGTEVTQSYLDAGLIDEDYDWRLSSFWTPTNAQGLSYAKIRKLKTVLGAIGFAAGQWDGLRVFADDRETALRKLNARAGYSATWDADGLVMRGHFYRAGPYRHMLELLMLASGARGARTMVWDTPKGKPTVIVCTPLDAPADEVQDGLVQALTGNALVQAPTPAALPVAQLGLWTE